MVGRAGRVRVREGQIVPRWEVERNVTDGEGEKAVEVVRSLISMSFETWMCMQIMARRK